MEETYVKPEEIESLGGDDHYYGKFYCGECKKVFISKKKLDGHNQFVHTIHIVICEFCSKEFKNKIACKQHVRNVHESVSNEVCQICSKVFKRKALLDAHIRNVHDSAEDLFCHVCGTQCKNLNALKKHVKKCEEKPKKAQKHFVPGNRVGDTDLGGDTFYDDVCDRTYLNYKSFRTHNHNTHLDDPISCRICGSVVKSRDLIRRHYMQKHNIQDKEVLKDLSGAGFAKRGQMRKGKVLETCPTCKQGYCQKYLNRFHLERCSLGRISTNPPLQPGFASQLPPEELLARYATPPSQELNDERIRRRTEKIKRWKQLEKLQLKKKASTVKRNDKKQGTHDNFAETDDNENMDVCKNDLKSNPKKFVGGEEETEMEESVKSETEEEMKEELEDNIEPNNPNIKKEESSYDEEYVWQEKEEDIFDGNIKSFKVLDKPNITDDIPALERFEQSKVKKEQEYSESLLCTECGKSFESVRTLVNHVDLVHTQHMVSCYESGEEQRNSMVFDQHLRNVDHVSSAEVKDKVASLDLIETEGIPINSPVNENVDDVSLISCETCIHEGKPPKIFKSRSCQKIHFNNWHKIGTYLCDTCGESFNLRGQLRNHNSAKHSQKSQPKGGACPHCGKVVKNVGGHIAIVHQKEECVCPICAKIFNTYKQMRDHMLYNHNNEGKVFICHICSKELGNELNLKQHLRRQHYQVTAPEDFVSCNECGKQFPTEYRLKSHHRAVHESDPSTCDVCGGNYKNNYSLSKHMKNAHSGDISGSTTGKGSYRMT